MLCHSVFSKGIIIKHTCAQRMSPMPLSHYHHSYLHSARRTEGAPASWHIHISLSVLHSWARGLQWNGAYSRISVRILLHPQPPAGLPQRGLQTSPAAQVHWEAQAEGIQMQTGGARAFTCTYVQTYLVVLVKCSCKSQISPSIDGGGISFIMKLLLFESTRMITTFGKLEP